MRAGEGDRPEVFMVRRSERSRFAADVYVFPGGTVHRGDFDHAGEPVGGLSPEAAHARLTDRGGEPPADPGLSRALHVAAVRELFEEAGVLLAANDRGYIPSDRSAAIAERLVGDRVAMQAGDLGLFQLLARRRLRLATDRLIYFSHWTTPLVSPRRYDTRFFVAEMPVGQTALHCAIETTAGEWVAPGEAIARSQRGDFKLWSVTLDHLERLARLGSVEELLSFARVKPIRSVLPFFDDVAGCWRTDVEDGTW